MVVKDEEARRLKLRMNLLRDENTTLKDQVSQKDGKISRLNSRVDDIRAQMEVALEKTRKQEKELRVLTRNESNLRVRLPGAGEED